MVPQRPQRTRAPAARAQCRAIESIDGDEIEKRCRRAEYIMVLAIGFNQAAMPFLAKENGRKECRMETNSTQTVLSCILLDHTQGEESATQCLSLLCKIYRYPIDNRRCPVQIP